MSEKQKDIMLVIGETVIEWLSEMGLVEKDDATIIFRNSWNKQSKMFQKTLIESVTRLIVNLGEEEMMSLFEMIESKVIENDLMEEMLKYRQETE